MNVVKSHPEKDRLIAFGLGKLAVDEARQVAEHLFDCSDCSETIVNLQDDSFVSLVRNAKTPAADAAQSRTVVEEQDLQPSTVEGVLKPPGDLSGHVEELPLELRDHPRYEIVGLIGKGGMGDVYQARHRMMDRTVAVKIINRELVRKPEAIDRFHREVKAAAQLSHPNIVTAYDAEQAGDVHLLVMEYVDGRDMSTIVKDRGALPITEACDSIRQAAIGLQHAHERGMVHRDIKPHNLMVMADGTVKILDFGLASLAPDPHSGVNTIEVRGDLTAVGAIMGTPDFISPEQADSARRADIRSDIYSLGNTLYFLLSGRLPFAGGSVMHKLKSHAQLEPEPVDSLRDDIPAGLTTVVSKMIEKDPADRFQTPAEVAIALEPFSGVAQPPTEKSSQLRALPSGARRRVGPLAALATLFFAGVVAAVVLYIQTNHGVVRVEVFDESLEVAINNQIIKVKEHNEEPLTIRAGPQSLSIRMSDSDFAFETNKFLIRRNDEIAFKVQLLEGKVVVSKNGKQFDSKPVPTQVGSTEITDLLSKAGVNEAEFKETLHTVLSQAASIPNAQWMKLATSPTASMDAVEGKPLSIVLLGLDPQKAAKENPAARVDFRFLNDRPLKPSELAKAMSLSSPHGYVSVIQTQYIKNTTLDFSRKEQVLRGSVEFEAPNLYAGKADFVVGMNRGWRQMQILEFTLPNYGIRIVRDKDGPWRRRPVAPRNEANDRKDAEGGKATGEG